MSIFLFLPNPALSALITALFAQSREKKHVNRKFSSGVARGHLDLCVGKPLKGARDSLAVLGGRRECRKVAEDNGGQAGLSRPNAQLLLRLRITWESCSRKHLRVAQWALAFSPPAIMSLSLLPPYFPAPMSQDVGWSLSF